MERMKVYIIIINYLNWKDTSDCITSLLASTYRGFSILVVDNYSANDSLQHLDTMLAGKADTMRMSKKEFNESFNPGNLPKVLLIQNDSNEGFACANNLVLKGILREDAYVWLLNPDMTMSADTLEQLVSFARQQQEQMIIGSVVRSYNDKNKILFYGGGRVQFNSGTVNMITAAEKEQELDYISGASLFTHVSNFRVAGLLPEQYFLIWEETDWCFAARQKGIGLAVCPAAVCYDKISTVIGKGFTAHYYYTRNGLYFTAKYRKEKTSQALFSAGLRFLKRVFTGQWGQARGVWRGVWDYLKRKDHVIE